MTIRPIVIYGDPVLHTPTEPVTEDISELIADMYETMDAANGVGLAANQVGVNKRVFVYNCPDDDGVMHRGCVVNPTLEVSEEQEEEEEGCLSVPGEAWPTWRAHRVTLRGYDEHGAPIELEASGFLARCFQHEVGHLDGYVYTDVLVGKFKRQAKRVLRDHTWGKTWMPGVDPDPFGWD
ncbi:peptide deformylase [Corynebacterium kozikiae]|uniref:peptide deformylase n=1 Tax=Corynebacterium kozikiae TaxID=2968469 RepID=UPI00211CFEA4|nr:peptide deformylase [Corynebacterium sp. 76QC2CO]MCQ9343720.1 peptide deformylase [Corynebacterium sp. 76QC2CO]MCQ9370979.1 peptide deformylase [Corynebacterium sp. 35RC1]